MFLILFNIQYGNVHYVSSGAMYPVEPVGCRIDPKGPSNIYFVLILIGNTGIAVKATRKKKDPLI